MTIEIHANVTAHHLVQKAYLYIRWATRRQGSASTEGTLRTEALDLTDWHRLVEVCAISDTLLLDEEGIYVPAHDIDRLLLGLDGPMGRGQPPRQACTREIP